MNRRIVNFFTEYSEQSLRDYTIIGKSDTQRSVNVRATLVNSNPKALYSVVTNQLLLKYSPACPLFWSLHYGVNCTGLLAYDRVFKVAI